MIKIELSIYTQNVFLHADYSGFIDNADAAYLDNIRI
jgi:hypothetical protein